MTIRVRPYWDTVQLCYPTSNSLTCRFVRCTSQQIIRNEKHEFHLCRKGKSADLFAPHVPRQRVTVYSCLGRVELLEEDGILTKGVEIGGAPRFRSLVAIKVLFGMTI